VHLTLYSINPCPLPTETKASAVCKGDRGEERLDARFQRSGPDMCLQSQFLLKKKMPRISMGVASRHW
jgi:hypothetical protein